MALLKIPLTGRTYTWSNKRPSPTHSRLDRAFLSSDWNTLGVGYSLTDLPTAVSDHVPLRLNITPHFHAAKRKFKFELFWLHHEQIQEIVQTAWDSVPNLTNVARRVHSKLKATQQALTRWSNQRFQSRDCYLKKSKWVLQQLDRVEEIRSLNQIEFDLGITIREHIFRLANVKETKWKQRAGCRWLKLGDNNTRYFHAVANERKNINNIAALNNDKGIAVPPGQITDALFQHFNTLLGHRKHQRYAFDLGGKAGPSFAQQLLHLDSDITEEEVHNAVNSLPKYKASGLDGMPAEFFQVFRPIIKGDLVQLIGDFMDGRSNIHILNRAAITLILKRE